MTSTSIFLDNNATTTLDRRVLEVMLQAFQQPAANPSSQHSFGSQARRRLEASRDQLAELADLRCEGINADQVIFTSGGTEANNLAIFGLLEKLDPSLKASTVAISSIEHPSVLSAAEQLSLRGCKVVHLPVLPSGQTDVERSSRMIKDLSAIPNQPLRLVSLMLANNETGVLQPVGQLAQICRSLNVLMHCDAVQAFGKIPVSFKQLDVDAMTISAHKLHGPVGIGALLIRHGVELAPQLWGGFQQMGLRPGTEPIALAAGFAEAARLAIESIQERFKKLACLRDRFEEYVMQQVPTVVRLGNPELRLPHTSCLAFPGRDRQSMQMALDVKGVACGTGSACASGSNQPSHVLLAMNQPEAIVSSALRFSVSHDQSMTEIETAAGTVASVANRKSLAKS